MATTPRTPKYLDPELHAADLRTRLGTLEREQLNLRLDVQTSQDGNAPQAIRLTKVDATIADLEQELADVEKKIKAAA